MAAGVAALAASAAAVAFLGGAARETGLVSRISIVIFRATSLRRRPRAIATRAGYEPFDGAIITLIQ
jgi:hypothetical protein